MFQIKFVRSQNFNLFTQEDKRDVEKYFQMASVIINMPLMKRLTSAFQDAKDMYPRKV